jgi:hypothetical protein
MLRITYPGLELSMIRKGVDAASTAALAVASGSSLGERVRKQEQGSSVRPIFHSSTVPITFQTSLGPY